MVNTDTNHFKNSLIFLGLQLKYVSLESFTVKKVFFFYNDTISYVKSSFETQALQLKWTVPEHIQTLPWEATGISFPLKQTIKFLPWRIWIFSETTQCPLQKYKFWSTFHNQLCAMAVKIIPSTAHHPYPQKTDYLSLQLFHQITSLWENKCQWGWGEKFTHWWWIIITRSCYISLIGCNGSCFLHLNIKLKPIHVLAHYKNLCWATPSISCADEVTE